VDPKSLEILRSLVAGQRVLALGVVVDGEPVVGLLPFAPCAALAGLVINVSGLARHTRGLSAGGPFAALVHLPDREDLDPLQIPRLTCQGAVAVPEEETGDYRAAREAYLARFPAAEPILDLGDFFLCVLKPKEGRLVTGFAGALNLSLDAWHAALAPE